jgi:hypothetical protein
MSELFPVLCGVCVGLVLGAIHPARRYRLGLFSCVALGISATVVSGEFRIGWEYLLIDIPLVGLSAAAVYWATSEAVRRLRTKAQ